MNKVILLGNLSADPEIKYSASDPPLPIARFSVAVNGYSKQGGEKRVDYINCVGFGKTAENIQKFFKKGSKIAVCGHIQVDKYTDKQKKPQTRTVIIVDEFFFAANKTDNTSGSEPHFEDGIDEEDLPF